MEGRCLRLPRRRSENVLEEAGTARECGGEDGMAESWWCRGRRDGSAVDRWAVDWGSESRKPCMEPRRREAPEGTEDKDDMRRRDFWRPKLHVTLSTRARDSELLCVCGRTASAAGSRPSFTAPSAMGPSRES